MKIAIANIRKDGFTPLWIEYCISHNIDYKLVNPYANDIIEQVKDCEIFMWNYYQGSHADMKCAHAILTSLQLSGKHVFPDINTSWWFDNKVYEKYLLESIKAPVVGSYVFYDRIEALEWIATVDFPKVFKLKGGAGASNVKLAKNKKDARKMINKAFGKGFPQYDWKSHFIDAFYKYKKQKVTLREVLRPLYYAIKRHPNSFSHYHGNEIGYVYFQDFMKNNSYDTRVIVIGDKAVAFKRGVRDNDFRASGSGIIFQEEIDEKMIEIGFQVAKKLHLQSVAFDFIYDENKNPVIIEMSYAFVPLAVNFNGYWTSDLIWHTDNSAWNVCEWQIEDIIKDSLQC